MRWKKGEKSRSRSSSRSSRGSLSKEESPIRKSTVDSKAILVNGNNENLQYSSNKYRKDYTQFKLEIKNF